MERMTKQSLYTGSIFKDYLLNQEFLDSKIGQELSNEHMLLGWLANKQEAINSKIYPLAKQEFKRQWHLNQTYLNLLNELAPVLEEAQIKPILLKGITFFEEMYPDLGDRSMSDLDLLVGEEELDRAVQVLKGFGFKLADQKKWKANLHKRELTIVRDRAELVVELHSSLLYHTKEPRWETRPFPITPYDQLTNEGLVIYQCVHLAFQHTFLKLFWLIDIHLILCASTQLDEDLILQLSKKYKVYNSVVMTLFLLKNYFDTPMGIAFEEAIKNLSPLRKSLLNINFLLDPKKNYLKYLAVKHSCKDSLKESMAYNMGWFKNRFFS